MRLGIAGPAVCLGMELHGGELQVTVLESFDRAVVHVRVGHITALGKGRCIDREPVVLGGDEDPPVLVFYRLVCPAVAELELVGVATEGECRDLVAHADAEDGELADAFFYGIDGLCGPLGIARAVCQEEAVRFDCKNVFGTCIVGEDIEITSPAGEACDHVGLEAEIDDGDTFAFSGDTVRCLAGDFRNGIDLIG